MSKTGYGRIYFKTLKCSCQRVQRVPAVGAAVRVDIAPEGNGRFGLSIYDEGGVLVTTSSRQFSGMQAAITEAYEIVRQAGYASRTT